MIAHFFWWFTGARNESSTAYGLQSGIGGSLPDVMLLIGLATLYRRHNCHERRCWRVGRHVVSGTPWCDRHHGSARRKL